MPLTALHFCCWHACRSRVVLGSTCCCCCCFWCCVRDQHTAAIARALQSVLYVCLSLPLHCMSQQPRVLRHRAAPVLFQQLVGRCRRVKRSHSRPAAWHGFFTVSTSVVTIAHLAHTARWRHICIHQGARVVGLSVQALQSLQHVVKVGYAAQQTVRRHTDHISLLQATSSYREGLAA